MRDDPSFLLFFFIHSPPLLIIPTSFKKEKPRAEGREKKDTVSGLERACDFRVVRENHRHTRAHRTVWATTFQNSTWYSRSVHFSDMQHQKQFQSNLLTKRFFFATNWFSNCNFPNFWENQKLLLILFSKILPSTFLRHFSLSFFPDHFCQYCKWNTLVHFLEQIRYSYLAALFPHCPCLRNPDTYCFENKINIGPLAQLHKWTSAAMT